MGKHSRPFSEEDEPRRKRTKLNLGSLGIRPISTGDFNDQLFNFKRWLKEEKGKAFSSLTHAEQDRYFDHRYMQKYNGGALALDYYGLASDSAPDPGPSTLPPESKRPRADNWQDQQVAKEDEIERERLAAKQKRKRERREAKEEEVAARATGRDRLREVKLAKRSAHQEFANRKEEELEFDQETLMGASDSFKKALADRERARQRHSMRKHGVSTEEKQAELAAKRTAHQQKELALMSQFREMLAGQNPAP